MALKFRRGTTAQKSGSLAFGEPYVNTTLGTLQIGLDNGDVTLASSNGLISGSSQVSYVELSNIPAGIISSSAQIDTLFNIDGLVSGSSQITISDTTGYGDFSSSLNSRILTEKGRVDTILSAADADKDSFAEIVTLINSVDTTNDNAFASFYTASVGRLNNLESTSASVNISVSNLNAYTGSNDTTNTTQNSRLDQLSTASGSAITRLSVLEVETANLETFSASTLTRLSTLEGKDISVTLTGDVTGTGTITDLGNVSFATTIAADSVVLGTDTTGNYMTNVSAGTGISVSHTPAEGSTATITNAGVTSLSAGTGVTLGATTGACSISIGQSVATNATPTFGNLTINGTITASGDITAYYTSDRRHKNNIKVITNALDKVKKLNGVTWEWNDDVNEVTKSTPTTGLIAQEVQEVLPQVVVERENGYLGLDYSKMMGLLVEAIKEQQIKIDNLTVEVERLKKQKGL